MAILDYFRRAVATVLANIAEGISGLGEGMRSVGDCLAEMGDALRPADITTATAAHLEAARQLNEQLRRIAEITRITPTVAFRTIGDAMGSAPSEMVGPSEIEDDNYGGIEDDDQEIDDDLDHWNDPPTTSERWMATEGVVTEQMHQQLQQILVEHQRQNGEWMSYVAQWPPPAESTPYPAVDSKPAVDPLNTERAILIREDE